MGSVCPVLCLRCHSVWLLHHGYVTMPSPAYPMSRAETMMTNILAGTTHIPKESSPEYDMIVIPSRATAPFPLQSILLPQCDYSPFTTPRTLGPHL